MKTVQDGFVDGAGPYWLRWELGAGRLEALRPGLQLANVDAAAGTYSNAQIDDYRAAPRRAFPWRPPLTLTVRARFSHPGPPLVRGGKILLGTAGFGFWNDPFMMSGSRFPMLPRAIWYFYGSPPSDMPLDINTPGYGWKAATIDAIGWPALLLAPAAPLLIPLMNFRPFYRRYWPGIQRAIRVQEALVDATMDEYHTYSIEWGERIARFSVDGRLLMVSETPPRGPLGLVIWKDNQYLVATPWGRFRYGQLAAPGVQSLDLEYVDVRPG